MPTTPPERANRLAVAICGAGHSGSTLLGLVLGSHSEVFYAGEAKKTLFLGDATKPLKKRACKLCGLDCPVWSRFAVPPTPDLYEQLARITGCSVVVDSTKKPDWIRERAAELDRAGVRQARVLLVRDGRAVVNSRVRKYPDEAPEAIIEAWRAQIHASRALIDERPEDGVEVRYEELATDPERVVRSLCAFLGLAFEPAMLRYHEHAHHPLGGNTGTQSVVARARESAAVSVPARSRDFYGPLAGGFRLDLRWREELPERVRTLFEERAGVDNRPFEWEGASR